MPSCDIDATSFLSVEKAWGLSSSDLLLPFGSSCSVATESSVDDAFSESDTSVTGIAFSSMETFPAVGSESEVTSGLGVTIK